MTPRDATISLALTVLSEADRHPHKQVGAWQTSVVLAREVVAQGETIAELRKMLGETLAIGKKCAVEVPWVDGKRIAEIQAALTELEESE